MIEFNEALIRELIFHRISNDDNENHLNSNLFDIREEEEDKALKRIFLKPFSGSSVTYEFKHDINLELNPLYKLSEALFEDGNLINISKNIHQHLKSVSKHPNIKDGDLFIVKYSDVKMANTYYDALGIYKIEKRENFLEISSGKLSLKKGIGNRKLDKACLILFTKKPYTIFIIDNGSTETDYWKNEFIKADYKNDDINNTNQIISLTKEFITKCLPSEFGVSKADQAEILNKSIHFFKSKDDFSIDEFTNEVINDNKVIESFKKYKANFEQEHEFEIANNFEISSPSVKKQTRLVKSIIKLDKNFDIYIHGNREFIEQGEDRKGKFYKVYYKEEK